MKQIYGEGAYIMNESDFGFMFAAYSLDVPEDMLNSGKTVIAYKQFKTEDSTVEPVTKSMYMINKFGLDFDFYLENLRDYLNCKAVLTENQDTFVVYPDGFAQLYTKGLVKKWSGSLKYQGFAPVDVVALGDFIWCSYPESNAIIKYNINSMQQVFRVGGSAKGGIIEPYGLWINENKLIITSSKSGKIIALDLDTFYTEELMNLDEPVKQYMKIGPNEFVLTKSGIYRL